MYVLKNKANNKYIIEIPMYSVSDCMSRYPTYRIEESDKIARWLLLSPYVAEQMKKVLKKEYDIDADMIEIREQYEEVK